MKEFLEQLKQRKIWRTLVAYPSVSFVLLQAAEFLINNYDLDPRYLTATFIACGAFLPAALIWNWNHGESGAQAIRKSEIGAYGLFSVIAIGFVSWFWLTTEQPAPSLKTMTESATSIAVMPFINPGKDAGVQYLCDGIAESLINWLAAQDDVKVSSKSASFRLREETDEPSDIGKRLGVDSVLQGRLERIGDQVVISASLVDTRDGSQIWGERLMRPDGELLFLERIIVDAITAGLSLSVTNPHSNMTASGGTNNPQAYEKYLKGHYLIQATSDQSVDEGLDELRAAIRLDPSFGLAYADIADALIQKMFYSMDKSPELIGEARTAALSAVALAPASAEAHTALAGIYVFLDFNWAAGEQSYENAIALKPSSPVPYHRYSDFLWVTLRTDRALEMAQKAVALDPLDSSSLHAVGLTHLIAGRYAESAAAFAEWNRFHPQSAWSYVKYAFALSLNGQCDLAIERLAVAEQLTQGRSPLLQSWMALSFHVCGELELLARSAARLEADLAEDGVGNKTALIWLRLVEGDIDRSVEILRHGVENRTILVPFMQIVALESLGIEGFTKLARDQRYIDMVEQANFPEHEDL